MCVKIFTATLEQYMQRLFITKCRTGVIGSCYTVCTGARECGHCAPQRTIECKYKIRRACSELCAVPLRVTGHEISPGGWRERAADKISLGMRSGGGWWPGRKEDGVHW